MTRAWIEDALAMLAIYGLVFVVLRGGWLG